MRSRALNPRMLRAERPSRALGVLVSLAAVAVSTGLVYPLKHLAPVQTLGVVYLLAVVIVSLGWGLAFGLATAVLSAVAFNLFHLPPVGQLSLAHNRDWVGLAAFAAVAVAVGLVGELARARARELEERRREADLASELAQLLLGAELLGDALAPAAGRLAQALGVSAAEIRLQPEAARPEPSVEDPSAPSAGSLPLRAGDEPLGTLELPAGASPDEYNRARERVVPALESILAAALHREELRAELVETAALRRSDEMKTAVLRSVSHDLRTPVTAILTAAGTLDPTAPSPEHVGEVRDLVLDAATRLWLLIEKLLDLSLLQAGRLEPVLTPCSIEDVLHEAVEQIRAPAGAFSVSIDRNLPPVDGDPAQLERAFVNVIENAARYSADKPVSVRARVVGGRLRVRIVDQGPGIEAAELERVFLPFYRSHQPSGSDPAHHGSGLGLAIARGFIEVNGGRIDVESHPGQGTSFVVEFPLAAAADVAPSAQPATTAGER
jgi:two-component system, OmpR family, sensor histidine kinase KdpD